MKTRKTKSIVPNLCMRYLSNRDLIDELKRRKKCHYFIVFPDGVKFQFGYEEMVELISAGMESTDGAECLGNMRIKAQRVWKSLPVTDY